MKRRKMLRATTLLISALTIFTLLLGTYFLFYRHFSSYNNQRDAVQKDLLSNFQRKVDETLENCTQCITSWALEENVIQFATEENLDSYNMISTSKMMAKTFLYSELDCIFGIFQPEQDIFLTNAGVHYSWDLMKNYGFVPETMEFIHRLPEKEFVNNYYLAEEISRDGSRLNLFIKRDLPGASSDLYGFVSLSLQGIVEQLSSLEDHTFFVIKDGRTIFSSNPDVEPRDLQYVSEPSVLLFDMTYGNGVVKENNALMVILYIFLFLLLAVFGLYGSFLVARWLNRPIENILRQLSDDDETEIYDEEAYIRGRFVEINTVNEQLKTRISAQDSYVKQNVIRDLLYGVANDATVTDEAERCELQKLCGETIVAVLEKKNGERSAPEFSNEILALLEAKFESGTVLFLNSEYIAIIARGGAMPIFKKELTQVILQITEWYGVSYTGAICEGTVDSPRELSRLFNEGMRYLQNGEFTYDTLVITADDLYERVGCNYYYPLEFERDIVSSIAANDFERALQLLQTILDKNLVEMKLNKGALTELKFAFVGTIKRILQVLKKTEVELFGEGSILYLELSACKTPEEISKKILEMFSAIRAYMETAYDAANYALIDRIEGYIQSNYHREDMSLLLLAEHFNLTTGYISKIFKKYREINFKEYLSACRIEKAAELLNEFPQIKISDLAQRVGYDNVNSLIRNFKKLKKVSPGEYKKHQ